MNDKTNDHYFFNAAERFVNVLPHCRLLGMYVESASYNDLVLALPYQANIIGNPHNGIIHGGALTTLVDTACGTIVLSALPELELCPTLDLRIDHLRPAIPGSAIYARSQAYRIAHDVVFVRCNAYQRIQGEDGVEPEQRDVSHCVSTFMRLGASQTPEMFKRFIEDARHNEDEWTND